MQKLGLFLIIASFLPWIAIPSLLPFLPLSTAHKAILVPALLILAEILWWTGVLIVGTKTAQKYKQYLSLKKLWHGIKKNWQRR
ncbi:transporter suffix domain-containing protein [Calothrix sp. 336/3]|uniref:transporter suffix domain-containing protein n=1 Tax=Calothrix sp. 336/3 TaxID=1337936 RepID=UPI0004E39ABD|nr:transporter suffix domain-containing protein [Calothrix sp. 336/3]AKG21051.1 hypothetical protein IJ00_06835 [Calothrix sp. 336/3]